MSSVESYGGQKSKPCYWLKMLLVTLSSKKYIDKVWLATWEISKSLKNKYW